MEWLREIWEVILDILRDHIFSVIKKRVNNKLLRATLYVLTWLIIIAVLVTPTLLGYAVVAWMLEGLSNIIG